MNTAVDIQNIAQQGNALYELIKKNYEQKHTGDFLAIDITSKDVFLGKSNSEAVEMAKNKYPDHIFYVVRIGYSATEVLESMARV